MHTIRVLYFEVGKVLELLVDTLFELELSLTLFLRADNAFLLFALLLSFFRGLIEC